MELNGAVNKRRFSSIKNMKQSTTRNGMELVQNGITMNIEAITSRSREGSLPKGAFALDFETAFVIAEKDGAKTINQDASAVNLARVFGGVEFMSRYLSATIARAMFSLQNPAKTKKGAQVVYTDAEKLGKLVEYFETIHETSNIVSDADQEFSVLNKRMAAAIKASDFATVGLVAMEMKALSDARAKLATAAE